MISRNMTRQFIKASDMNIAKSDSQIGSAMRKYSAEGDHEKLGTIINRISGKTVQLVTEATEGLHDSHRNPRTGRPTRERFVVLNEPSVTQTVAGVQKRVGYGKSGWLQAFGTLGRQPPKGFGWVRMASKQAGGYALIVNSLTTPSVTVANAAPHGANLLKMKSGDNLCERALRMRANKMFDRLAYTLKEPKVKK